MDKYGKMWTNMTEIRRNIESNGERYTLGRRCARKFENARLPLVAARPMPSSSWMRRRYATRRVYVGRGINKGTMTGTGEDSVGAGETSAAPRLEFSGLVSNDGRGSLEIVPVGRIRFLLGNAASSTIDASEKYISLATSTMRQE